MKKLSEWDVKSQMKLFFLFTTEIALIIQLIVYMNVHFPSLTICKP